MAVARDGNMLPTTSRVQIAICKVAITLRSDVARHWMKSAVSTGAEELTWRYRLCDLHDSTWESMRSGFVSAERDGYFFCQSQTAICTRLHPLYAMTYNVESARIGDHVISKPVLEHVIESLWSVQVQVGVTT